MYDFFAFLGPNDLSVIERCLYYGGIRKERLHCTFANFKYEELSYPQIIKIRKCATPF